jgi:ribosomal protein L37AE/L43A
MCAVCAVCAVFDVERDRSSKMFRILWRTRACGVNFSKGAWTGAQYWYVQSTTTFKASTPRGRNGSLVGI